MNDLWGGIKTDKLPRNTFNLSHEHKGSCNHGKIVPIFWREVLPGDTWHVSCEVLIRAVPLLAPAMHLWTISVDTFFAPNRLLWDSWETFITQGMDGTQAPTHPTFQLDTLYGIGGGPTAGWLLRTGQTLDKLGLATLDQAGASVLDPAWNLMRFNALPLRAYGLICDTWFRNESITASQLSSTFKADGPMNVADLTFCATLQAASWQKDYFTGGLPNAQRGPAASAPVVTSSTGISSLGAANPLIRNRTTGAQSVGGAGKHVGYDALGQLAEDGNAPNVYFDPMGSLWVTAQAIRTAEKLQRFSEKRNVSGPRYIEHLKMFFGVTSSDARLQMVEYCGGGRSQLTITEVLQNSANAAQPTPMGTIAGRGIDHQTHRAMGGYFEEHGILMTVMRVAPMTAYMNLVERHWRHLVFSDYYFPDFAHLGEQAVYRGETFGQFDNAAAQGVFFDTFSYNPRFSEYKFAPSIATGQQKETLSYWNLNRKYGAMPNLNTSFVTMAADNRVFADTTATNDHYLYQIMNHVFAKRSIPFFSDPKL